MLTSNAISEMRLKINDRDMVGLDDSELLSYLNEAIQFIAAAMITYKSPLCVKDIDMTEPTMVLPNNFAQLCGNYPVKITGKIISTSEDLPLTIRYFESFGDVELDGSLPFHHTALDKLAVKIGCIYAQNQEHEEISQDKSLVNELQQMVASALGVGA